MPDQHTLQQHTHCSTHTTQQYQQHALSGPSVLKDEPNCLETNQQPTSLSGVPNVMQANVLQHCTLPGKSHTVNFMHQAQTLPPNTSTGLATPSLLPSSQQQQVGEGNQDPSATNRATSHHERSAAHLVVSRFLHKRVAGIRGVHQQAGTHSVQVKRT